MRNKILTAMLVAVAGITGFSLGSPSSYQPEPCRGDITHLAEWDASQAEWTVAACPVRSGR
jgi:hypothetical protein